MLKEFSKDLGVILDKYKYSSDNIQMNNIIEHEEIQQITTPQLQPVTESNINAAMEDVVSFPEDN